MVMLITGLVLGLVWNHFHPMKLPLTLEEVKVPGIPAHIWDQFRFATVKEAFAKTEQMEEGKAFLVDTRGRSSFEKERCPGAVWLPYNGYRKTFKDFADKISKNATLYIYCYGSGCMLAPRVAKRLMQDGYKNVVVVKGGIEAWKKAELPMVRAEKKQEALP